MRKVRIWYLIIIIILVLVISIYIQCSFVSRHEIGLYGECKVWKESGYEDEKFPTMIQPSINEEYIPEVSKEEIINRTKDQCENILRGHGICCLLNLWEC